MPIPGNMLSSVTEMVDPNTSGWTAKLNATLLLGTGGRNGDGCLAVKSIASGEMQARTVSSYTVIPGTTYQVFADASGATVPERIGIRWLTASNTEVSITWSLTTSAASASWHRIGVAGAAPATAVRAQVVVSATTAAPNVISYFENVYLGLPIRTVGNLLSFNTESSEVDATGWGVAANATISRQAPATTWAVDWYLAGGEMLAMSVTANGNASLLAVTRSSVTPGTEYLAYAYLQPPTSGSTAWIELRFYTLAGSQISATRSTLAAPGTGVYRQSVSVVAPPTAATCSVAVGLDTATAAQVLRVETVVVMVAPALQAGTVIPYADASFEQGIAGWTVTSGVATLARSTPWGVQAVDGAYSLTVSSATATASVLRSAKFPLAAGSAGLGFRLLISQNVTAGGWTLTRGVRWYSATNTDLGLTASTAAAASAPGWWYLYRDMTAPAGATQAAVELTLTATATTSVIRLDSIALWQALPLTDVVVDEDTASVTLTVRELTTGFLLTVSRVDEAGARTLVRGTSGVYDGTFVIVSDLMVIEDYEAPLGVPVYYVLEIADPVGGTVETRTTATVTIPHDDINMAWLKDPGNPQRNTQVMVQRAPDWQRPVEQSAYVIKGRRNKVVLSGRRQGLEGDLNVWTQSDDERAALHWLLDSGTTLLWQAAPGMGVTDMYVSVGQITEARAGGAAMDPWRAWTLPLTEADTPVTTGVNGSAGRTWIDVVSEFATCNDVLATYATCEDLLLDRRTG